jgi:enoyl-CoA hydratase/carnithine racemase
MYGNGGGFSTGIDLNAFSHIAESFGANWQEHMQSVTTAFQNVLNKLERCSLPSIALLKGYALGLGFELALACDFRIAARHTKIALPETRLGLIPDVGGTTRLTRLIGPSRAKEVILTGKVIQLEQAERWGLVNAVVPGKELFAKGEILAAEIIHAAPLAVSAAKRVIDGMADIDRGLQMEAWAQNHLIQTADFQTGLQAARSKSPPAWQDK